MKLWWNRATILHLQSFFGFWFHVRQHSSHVLNHHKKAAIGKDSVSQGNDSWILRETDSDFPEKQDFLVSGFCTKKHFRLSVILEFSCFSSENKFLFGRDSPVFVENQMHTLTLINFFVIEHSIVSKHTTCHTIIIYSVHARGQNIMGRGREITSYAPLHFLVFQGAYEHQGIQHPFFYERPSSMVLLGKQWPISDDKYKLYLTE